jgi:hypothetical protein
MVLVIDNTKLPQALAIRQTADKPGVPANRFNLFFAAYVTPEVIYATADFLQDKYSVLKVGVRTDRPHSVIDMLANPDGILSNCRASLEEKFRPAYAGTATAVVTKYYFGNMLLAAGALLELEKTPEVGEAEFEKIPGVDGVEFDLNPDDKIRLVIDRNHASDRGIADICHLAAKQSGHLLVTPINLYHEEGSYEIRY